MKKKIEAEEIYCDYCGKLLNSSEFNGCSVCDRDVCARCATHFQMTWGDDQLERLVVCSKCIEEPTPELEEFMSLAVYDKIVTKEQLENLTKMEELYRKITGCGECNVLGRSSGEVR
jgi:DNA-directed RNA polymerase subunit RPC12/RpoP